MQQRPRRPPEEACPWCDGDRNGCPACVWTGFRSFEALDRAAAQKDATAHGAYLASCNWCNTVVAMAEPLPFDMAFLCSRCHQRTSSPALPAAPRGTWS